MSNVDELLKFKKLLDDNAITEEEYEKMKKKLLNEEVVQTNNENINQNTNNKKRKSGCLIVFIVIFLPIIVVIAILGSATDRKFENMQANKKLIESYENIENVLKDIGFENYTIERDEEGDNIYAENTICFLITEKKSNFENYKEINADMIIKDNKIYGIYLFKRIIPFVRKL